MRFRLIALVLASLPAYAEPPFLPVAVCDKGKCVMSEGDFKTLQKFHVAVQTAAQEFSEQVQTLAEENAALRQKLARAAYCQSRRS